MDNNKKEEIENKNSEKEIINEETKEENKSEIISDKNELNKENNIIENNISNIEKGKKDDKKKEEVKDNNAEAKKEEGQGQEEVAAAKDQNLGPQDLQGEELFGVCHICATFNDTFIHVTDLSGRETYARVTGGMKVKADREEHSPYAAMLAAQDVHARLKQLGVGAIHIKVRGRGGADSRTPGPGAQAAMRALARLGLKIGRIEDVTPIPTDSTRKAGGRRGRRL